VRRRRHHGRAVGLAVVAGVVVASLSGSVALPTPASAYPSSSVTIEGHGYGHGHGMGQWGALGYALAQTPYQSILGNYYGGTSLATLSGPQESTTVRVDMTENDGNQIVVTSSTPFTVVGRAFPRGPGCADGADCAEQPLGRLVRATRVPAMRVALESGGALNPNPTATPSPERRLGDPHPVPGRHEQRHHARLHRGHLQLQRRRRAPSTTVPLEQYVDGVVPNESPAGWGTLGGAGPQGEPWGFQELEAQAVAVRSYVMASPGSYGGRRRHGRATPTPATSPVRPTGAH
jgi:hypothetical protein